MLLMIVLFLQNSSLQLVNVYFRSFCFMELLTYYENGFRLLNDADALSALLQLYFCVRVPKLCGFSSKFIDYWGVPRTPEPVGLHFLRMRLPCVLYQEHIFYIFQ